MKSFEHLNAGSMRLNLGALMRIEMVRGLRATSDLLILTSKVLHICRLFDVEIFECRNQHYRLQKDCQNSKLNSACFSGTANGIAALRPCISEKLSCFTDKTIYRFFFSFTRFLVQSASRAKSSLFKKANASFSFSGFNTICR